MSLFVLFISLSLPASSQAKGYCGQYRCQLNETFCGSYKSNKKKAEETCCGVGKEKDQQCVNELVCKTGQEWDGDSCGSDE